MLAAISRMIKLIVVMLVLFTSACSDNHGTPLVNGNSACEKNGYFHVDAGESGRYLMTPDHDKFVMRGVVYAPLEGALPDFSSDLFGELSQWIAPGSLGENYAPPVRNDLSGLQEDLDLIKEAGFNQIKLWNVPGLMKLNLLKPFLLACEQKKIGVMLALVGPIDDDGWQLSKDLEKIKSFKLLLADISLQVSSLPSVISINIYAPEIRTNYSTDETREIIEDLAYAVKKIDKNRLVAVFIDRNPSQFNFPRVWSENIDLIGIQPYGVHETFLDVSRILNDISYYSFDSDHPPIFIDEWGLRTETVLGTHSLVAKKYRVDILKEFLTSTETLNIVGWSYFMLRDKIWEGDFGIIEYDYDEMKRKDTFTTLQDYMRN